jgi:hypothetical protein
MPSFRAIVDVRRTNPPPLRRSLWVWVRFFPDARTTCYCRLTYCHRALGVCCVIYYDIISPPFRTRTHHVEGPGAVPPCGRSGTALFERVLETKTGRSRSTPPRSSSLLISSVESFDGRCGHRSMLGPTVRRVLGHRSKRSRRRLLLHPGTGSSPTT